ncbi:MAG: vWA domain-containing protein [Deltaproteobacteria bacterium]|nr:vWA domain-containing protein [Deltaproteobacteria bacterium]
MKSPTGQNTVQREGPLVRGVTRPKVTAQRSQFGALVMDVSSSMAGSKIVEANAALAELVATLAMPKNRRAFHLAVVTYATGAKVHLAQKVADDIRPENLALTADGDATNIHAGLAEALACVEKAPSDGDWQRPIVVLMTDGRYNQGPAPDGIATTLKAKADLIAVGFGADADIPLLERLANTPKHAVRCTSGDALRAYFLSVATTMSRAAQTGQNAAALLRGGGVIRE